jgi:hypothetical protein
MIEPQADDGNSWIYVDLISKSVWIERQLSSLQKRSAMSIPHQPPVTRKASLGNALKFFHGQNPPEILVDPRPPLALSAAVIVTFTEYVDDFHSLRTKEKAF